MLGIDPGSRVTGYGVISQTGNLLVHISSGVIQPPAKDPLPLRLHYLRTHLAQVVLATQPQVMAVESIFYAKNVKSAIQLAHARGVALLVAAEMGLDVAEYSPMEIKRSVTGYGRADKEQVLTMLRHLFRLPEETGEKLYDSSDALAAALTHLNIVSTQKRISQSEARA